MNNVQLIGNLTRDPESRDTRSEMTIASMRVAVNGRNNKVGYFDVTVFGKLADVCLEYLEKGRKVAISGRLDYQEWENANGDKRSKVEIIASEVDFLPTANKSGGEDFAPEAAPAADDEPKTTSKATGTRKRAPKKAATPAPVPAGGVPEDDDIPF